MARTPKSSGRDKTGPWTTKHIAKALKRAGWYPVTKPPHENFKHPDRSGKITVDHNWTSGIPYRDDNFAWMAAQGKYSKRQFRDLINAV